MIVLLFAGLVAQASPGDLDPSYATGAGPNGEIRQLVPIGDGKALISGWFETYDGTPRRFFARVKQDGTLDDTFNAGAGPEQGTVQCILPLGDGKILVGGLFSTFAGVNRPLLARLEETGAVDQSFDLHLERPSEASGGIGLMRAQPNGQLLVSGVFTFRGESEVRNLARFNADGTPDRIFQPNLNIYWLDNFAVQADGCVVISGGFQSKQGASLNHLLRLMPDGSLDASFQAPEVTNSPSGLAIQPDGKIVAAGYGISFRLLANGEVDPSYSPALISRGEVRSLIVQTNGKILIAGQLNDGVNPGSRGVVRLNADGTLDPTFSTGAAGIPGVQRADIDVTGNVLVAGLFATVQGTSKINLARLDGGEAVVEGAGEFQLVWPVYVVNEGIWNLRVAIVRKGGNSLPATVRVETIPGTATLADFMPIIGPLSFVSGETMKVINIPIVNESLIESDEEFSIALSEPTGGATLGSPANATVTLIDDDKAGRLEWSPVVNDVSEGAGTATLTVTRNGGTFGAITVKYATIPGSASEGTDYTAMSGTLSFADGENLKTVSIPLTNDPAKEGPESLTIKLSEPTGGSILGTGITGTINIVDDDMPGALAPGFSVTPPPEGFANDVRAVVELPDGKILVADSLYQHALRRLNPDGSTDSNFAPVFPFGAWIDQIIPQVDGRIILMGSYLRESNDWRRELLRLNVDGSEDLTFNPGSGNGMLSRVALQPDGKLIVIGTFTSIGGGSRTGMARLNSDGSLDPSFTAEGFGPTTDVDAIVVQTDGKILIGGFAFNIIRLHSGGERDTDFAVDPSLRLGSSRTNALALQPDGKILAAGHFNFADATARTLIRLLPGGLLDPSFDAGVLPSQGYFEATFLLLQPDGKMVANGFPAFTPSGDSYGAVQRRNPDGSLDSSFQVIGYIAGKAAALTQSGALLLSRTLVIGGSELVKVIGGDLDVPTGGELGFGWADYSVSETSGKAVVHVVRKNGNTGPATVNYATADDTALAVRDYVSQSGTLTFASGEVAKAIEVPVLNTAAVDGIRQFKVLLTGPSGAALSATAVTTVSIRDDERAGRVQFETTTFTVREGASVNLKVKRLFGNEGRITVDYLAIDQTAAKGADFNLNTGTLVFEAGEIEKSFSVQSLTDGINEGPETFQVQLVKATGSATVGTPSTATVTIRDIDDGGSISSFTVLGAEPQILTMVKQPDGKVLLAGSFPGAPGEMIVRLKPNGTLDETFNADLITGAISKMVVQGDGKILLAGALVSPGGNPSPTALLRLNSDGTIDPTLTGVVTTNESIFAIGAQSDGKIILAGLFTSVNETPRPYLARLLTDGTLDTLFQPSVGALITTMVVDRDDSILCGTRPNKIVRFKPDGTTDANFRAQFTSQFNNSNLSPSCIVVDDYGRILVGGIFTTVNATSRKNLARLLPNGVTDSNFFAGGASSDGAPDVVALQDDGRIFIGSYHYYGSGGVLRLLEDGTRDASFNVEPVASSLWAHLSGLALLGDRGLLVSGEFEEIDGIAQKNLALLLLGRQPGGFRIAGGRTRTVTENGGPVTVTINRVGGSEGQATLNYQTSSNPPQSADFVSTSGTLVFEEGETSKSFEITLIDDSQHESAERFFVQFTMPENAFLFHINEWLDVTIEDNDPRMPGALQFSASAVEVNEEDGNVILTVERTGGLDGAVSVVATTVAGTASEGADYVYQTGNLSFANGESSRTIVVPILGGDIAEPAETFSVTLSDPLLGATLGDPATVTVTIRDQDAGTLDAFKGTYAGVLARDGAAGSGFVTMTVGLRGSVSGVLMYGGKRYAFKGRLNTDGVVTLSLRRKGATPLELRLALNVLSPETEQLMGSVLDDGLQSDFAADRQTYHATNNPTDAVGRYTFVLQPNDPDVPEGTGYALMNVTKGGAVRVTGKLSDGSAFSQAAYVSKFGQWPLFAQPYRKTGVLSGMMQLGFAERWVLSGTARWVKPARAKDAYYSNGFDGNLTVYGGEAPASVFEIPESSTVAATLYRGGFDTLVGPLPLTRQPRGVFRGDLGIKVSISSATGLLTGEFVHPTTKRRVQVRGVLLFGENSAGGFFLGPDSSGSFGLLITPPPAP